MYWLWCNTANLSKQQLYTFLKKGADYFYQAVAWCSVYHPVKYMETIRFVDQKVEVHVRDLCAQIGLARLQKQFSTEVPPPREPPIDEQIQFEMDHDGSESDDEQPDAAFQASLFRSL